MTMFICMLYDYYSEKPWYTTIQKSVGISTEIGTHAYTKGKNEGKPIIFYA